MEGNRLKIAKTKTNNPVGKRTQGRR